MPPHQPPYNTRHDIQIAKGIAISATNSRNMLCDAVPLPVRGLLARSWNQAMMQA